MLSFPPRPSPFSRFSPPRAARRLAAACCLLALAGCSGGAQAVEPPRPPAAQAKLCRALHRVLPGRLFGARRRAADPVSPYTAAWGSPAIVLRCGVPRPDVLTSGNAHYKPDSESMRIGGVDWLPQKLADGGARCTVTLRRVYVEVTVPARYLGPDDELSDLAELGAAIRRTVPPGLV